MANRSLAIIMCATTLLSVGCGDEEAGSGTYEVRIYGEAFIEDFIPAAETDGWRIEFDEFLVAVSGISASGSSGNYALSDAYVFDLTQPSDGAGHLIASLAASEGRIDSLDFRIGPVDAAVAGNVDAADVETMTANGYAILLSGTATRPSTGGGDDEIVTFEWAFDTNTTYRDCHTTASIPDGGIGASVLTIHADHLFYDDLVSETPNVAFDLIASADDGDGAVTADELEALDITTQSRYQVGSLDIEDLWAFIEAQSRTVGHIDGEGHCEAH